MMTMTEHSNGTTISIYDGWPLPLLTSYVRAAAGQCASTVQRTSGQVLDCVRPHGHTGDHEFGGVLSGIKQASWPEPQHGPDCGCNICKLARAWIGAAPTQPQCTCSRPSNSYIPEAHEPRCSMFRTVCACGMADGLLRNEQCPACGGTQRADEQGTTPAPDLTPVTLPEPTRAVRIAAIHAAGVHLAESPFLPVPGKVELTVHDLTYEQVRALAELHDVEVQQRSGAIWVEFPIAVESLCGVEINYIAYANKETR